MKINAIVCEFNPLHNGHLYLIEKVKSQNPDSFTVCIMSGNFVQRGEPAIIDKWERTKWALDAGADLVLELPTLFALQTADKFAFGAIKIASMLNCDGYVCFGSENPDIEILMDIAKTIMPENSTFKYALQPYLDSNLPYASARQNAIVDCLMDKYSKEILVKTISSSNCILAIAYIKALYILKSKLIPIAIERQSSLYNEKSLNGKYSSATAIRESMKTSADISYTIPSYVYKSLNENALPESSYFDNIILYKLRSMKNEELADIIDVSEGLENLILKATKTSNSLKDVISFATNKRYTSARIRRICYCAMLGITKKGFSRFNEIEAPCYARVLGFKKEAQPLLKHIKEMATIPLITSVKDGLENENISSLLTLDIFASDIYSLSLSSENCEASKDFTKQIIVR